ncbi:HNH endonuclease [Nocardia amikacinitolerans]
MPNEWWNILLGFYKSKCAHCGSSDDTQHDHVIPITWPQSTHSLYNSQILCKPCNSSKGNRHATDYRDWSNGILCERVVT